MKSDVHVAYDSSVLIVVYVIIFKLGITEVLLN